MLKLDTGNCDVFVPTFKRPNNIKRVIDDLSSTTLPFALWFIIEKHDLETIDSCDINNAKYIFNEGRGTYACAINTAYKRTNKEFFFNGADDLYFNPNWLEVALRYMENNKIMVVGTNDLHNSAVLAQAHATHYLVRRSYIQTQSGVADAKDTVLFDYDHNFTDTEFICTAQARRVYAHANDCIVEHKHWIFGLSKKDETYLKGEAKMDMDKKTFYNRVHLWESEKILRKTFI